MKKGITVLLAILMLGVFFPCFADRNTSTIKGYSASALVKRGDWKIYRIDFVATTAVGSFTVYDTILAGTDTNVKAEGGEGVVGNSKTYDFTNKPLEGSTGLYLLIKTGNVVIEYE